jgi:hypothetical protein
MEVEVNSFDEQVQSMTARQDGPSPMQASEPVQIPSREATRLATASKRTVAERAVSQWWWLILSSIGGSLAMGLALVVPERSRMTGAAIGPHPAFTIIAFLLAITSMGLSASLGAKLIAKFMKLKEEPEEQTEGQI